MYYKIRRSRDFQYWIHMGKTMFKHQSNLQVIKDSVRVCTSYAIVMILRYPSTQVVLFNWMYINQISHDNICVLVVLGVESGVAGRDGCRRTWTFFYHTWIFQKYLRTKVTELRLKWCLQKRLDTTFFCWLFLCLMLNNSSCYLHCY